MLIAEALKIGDPAKSAHCTVCHSPLESVPRARLVADARVEPGVGCESCHGPAQPWLRFHTRPDVTHAQRVAAGMRELGDYYDRANTCIRCHLSLDPVLLGNGHPELLFDFDGQMALLPPHWKDTGAWLGPRAWLVGQAAALREWNWKLARAPDHALASRARGLAWLLRQTEPGAARLPRDEAKPAEMQAAADRLAQTASKIEWTRESTARLLRTLAASHLQFRDLTLDAMLLSRRAEVLVLAIDRLWAALKTGGAQSAELDTALRAAAAQTGAKGGFDQLLFADTLQQIDAAAAK